MSAHFQSSHYASRHFASSHYGRVADVPVDDLPIGGGIPWKEPIFEHIERKKPKRDEVLWLTPH